jgi:hypothetical protein
VQRDQDVRRLDVTVNDSLLMRVLMAWQTLMKRSSRSRVGRLCWYAILGDLNAAHQFP